MHNLTTLLTTILLLILLSSCAGNSSAPPFQQHALPGVNKSLKNYQINPEDKLHIEVFRMPELSSDVVVTEVGLITLPLIGSVQVGGLTPKAAENLIVQQYIQGFYLKNPQISVTVTESPKRFATVYGAVKKPGVHPIQGEPTLMNVLALCEGVTDVGKTSEITLFRKNASGTVEAYHYDLDDIMEGTAADPLIISGDTIVVEESGWKVAGKTVLKVIIAIVSRGAFFL